MATTGVQLIFGGASFGGMGSDFTTVSDTKEGLDLLADGGVKVIDSARFYQNSESYLGQAGAATRFLIDTKYPGGFAPEPSTRENVIESTQESLRQLGTDQINVYYIHAPDRRVPLEEILDALNSLYLDGKFKKLGLSNFLPEEVEEVIQTAKRKNYVLPSVYQGNYSAVARHSEAKLLPILRENNISFYAYSPIAGGFLTKDVEQLTQGTDGRWDPTSVVGGMYNTLYGKPGMLEGLRRWGEIAKRYNIPKAELAYRWVAHHSALRAGDAVIFGSRNGKQIQGTLNGLKNGPLAPEVAEEINDLWKIVEADAPVDNFNSLVAK